VLASVAPNAVSRSIDTVAFTSPTSSDPCPALTWRIEWENLQGERQSRDVASEALTAGKVILSDGAGLALQLTGNTAGSIAVLAAPGPTPVPEPRTARLLLLGLAALGALRVSAAAASCRNTPRVNPGASFGAWHFLNEVRHLVPGTF